MGTLHTHYAYKSAYARTHTHIHTHTHIFNRVHIHTIYICTHINTYTKEITLLCFSHTYIHEHTHTHIRTHMFTLHHKLALRTRAHTFSTQPTSYISLKHWHALTLTRCDMLTCGASVTAHMRAACPNTLIKSKQSEA
jgi:hypothetical protein